MFRKLSNRIKSLKLSLKTKIVLSLSAIAVTLLVSSVISMLMYSRMSSYVSGLIADNINSINLAQSLSKACSEYNMEILTVVGDDDISADIPVASHQESFFAHCDSLKLNVTSGRVVPLADSVLYAYSAYMMRTKELNNVLFSDFIDTREWYFESLQPQYARLTASLDALSAEMYNVLKRNSETFDRGFYRSIIPSIVALAVGLLMLLMLLFFISVYYVNPIYRMLKGLNAYNEFNTRYSYEFEGDDQLYELNSAIKELTSENQQLRKRISTLRNTNNGQQ